MLKPQKLNQRERLLLKALAKGATFADAAQSAGYKAKQLRQSGFQAFEKIKRKMPELLDEHGLTDASVIDKYLRPGLEAMETEFAKFEGRISDSRDVIAWGPRLQALDMLFKLKGSYAPKEITGAGGIPLAVEIVTNMSLRDA